MDGDVLTPTWSEAYATSLAFRIDSSTSWLSSACSCKILSFLAASRATNVLSLTVLCRRRRIEEAQAHSYQRSEHIEVSQTCSMPPPLLSGWWCRKKGGSPSALHNQSIMFISNSVHAGLDACSKPVQTIWSVRNLLLFLLMKQRKTKGFNLTQVNPTQLIASASMSPSIEGHEVRLG